MLIDCWLEDVGVCRGYGGEEGVLCLATSSSVLSYACVAQTCLVMQEDSAVADVVVREGVASTGVAVGMVVLMLVEARWGCRVQRRSSRKLGAAQLQVSHYSAARSHMPTIVTSRDSKIPGQPSGSNGDWAHSSRL